MIATLAGSLLAFFRETLVAAHLGADWQMDAYFFALALVMLVPQFMSSSIGESLVPVYIHYKGEEGLEALHRFISSAINLYLFFLAGTSVFAASIAPFTIPILGSGFDSSSQQFVLHLIWILLPTISLSGFWGLLAVILNAEGLFFVSAISRTFLSVGVIGMVLLTSRQLGVYSLPIGVVLSSLGQVIWAIYWLRRKGVKFSFVLDIRDPVLRRFLALLWPPIIGSFLLSWIPIIDRSMASHLPEGTISALGYSDRLMSILGGLSISALNTVLLAFFSLQLVGNDTTRFRERIAQTLGMLMFVLMPLSLILFVVRTPLIQLVFERGKFDAVATANTASVFGGYVLGLMPMAIAITLSTGFNALEDTKTQSFLGAGSSLIAKLVLNPILIVAFGAAGIALATSLMFVVSGTLLGFVLRRRLAGIGGKRLLRTFSSVSITSLLAVSPAYLMANHLHLPPVVVLVFGALVGSTLYLLFSALLNIPELVFATGSLLRIAPFRLLGTNRDQAGRGSGHSGRDDIHGREPPQTPNQPGMRPGTFRLKGLERRWRSERIDKSVSVKGVESHSICDWAS